MEGILNINNVYFDNIISQIYHSELQLNKANASDTEAAFLDLHLSISNDIVSTKIYDKRDNFDFKIVNFPCLDGDVPRSTSFVLLEYLAMLLTSTLAINYNLLKYCMNKYKKMSYRICSKFYDSILYMQCTQGHFVKAALFSLYIAAFRGD